MVKLIHRIELVASCLMLALCALFMLGMYGPGALVMVVVYPVGGVVAVAALAWLWYRVRAWLR